MSRWHGALPVGYTVGMTPAMRNAAFRPKVWVLPHSGTNGYITAWGEMQSGTQPFSHGDLPLRPLV